MSTRRWHFAALNEEALLVTGGDGVDAGTVARVRRLAAALRAEPLAGVREVVPAFASVTVWFSPEEVLRARGGGRSALATVAAWVRRVASSPAQPSPSAPRLHLVPVVYGGEHGPDLEALARHAGMGAQEVVTLHAATEYEVAVVGFAPGFPYLLGLDERLHAPRHATPRVRVPSGSVGIGGAQTGIYPLASPGGWQLIGRTPLALFDVERDPPARFVAGDKVRFRPIDASEWSRSVRAPWRGRAWEAPA